MSDKWKVEVLGGEVIAAYALGGDWRDTEGEFADDGTFTVVVEASNIAYAAAVAMSKYKMAKEEEQFAALEDGEIKLYQWYTATDEFIVVAGSSLELARERAVLFDPDNRQVTETAPNFVYRKGVYQVSP